MDCRGRLMRFIVFFLLLTLCYSNFNPVVELKDLVPESAWESLCANFRELKQMAPERLKRLIEKPLFRQRIKIFKNQIRNFFADSTLEAFTALEWASKDAGMVLFFVRFLWDDINHVLIDYGEIHFSFEEICRNKKLSDWETYLKKTIEIFLNFVLCNKTSELLRVVLRIFQNLERKTSDALEIEHLYTGIKILKHEIIVLDMNLNETTPEETIASESYICPQGDSESSIIQGDLFVDPKITFIHKNLIECFYQIRAIFRSEGSTKELCDHFCQIFQHFKVQFEIKSGDLSFLLDQRIEFVLIMIDSLINPNGMATIRQNFEALFQGPKEDRIEKIKKLVESSRKQLAKITQFKENVKNKAEEFKFCRYWNKISKVLKNSVEDFNKISKKIELYYPPSSEPNPPLPGGE
jgi:hypothetical protein